MKKPFLIFSLSILSLSSADFAFARGGVENSLEAWDRLKEAGRDVREGIFQSVETIKAASRDVRHERPLLMSEYVTAVKKGKEVTLIYCESRLKRMADAQRCEKIHSGSFKIDELKSCIDKVEGDKQPGMILNRNLKAVADSEYGHDHFKMYDSKESYREYLEQCQAALSKKPSRNIAARPAEEHPVRKPAVEEFRPFEPSAEEAVPFDLPENVPGKL